MSTFINKLVAGKEKYPCPYDNKDWSVVSVAPADSWTC